MKIVSNYKNLDLRNFIYFFFKSRKRTYCTLIFFFLSIIITSLLNIKTIQRKINYLNEYELNDISLYLKDLTSSYDLKKEIKRVDLIINFKNISKLNCFRELKENCGRNQWAKGILRFDKQDYPIKLRAKGDRKIHRLNFKTMSFKIDIKGRKRLIGMEEFSLQRPIIRGYTSELIAAELAKENNIISPRNLYVRLYINGEYYGLRHIEEAYSRELIESNMRRYGPVFSLDENFNTIFGNVKFDISDNKNWNNKKIIFDSLQILEETQNDPQVLKKNFDQELWANYFALMDILLTYHGSIPKSVRFYLNPTTEKFEPAFYDGHRGTGDFNDFLLIDFIKKDKNKIFCEWLCSNSKWYQTFFMDGNYIDQNFYKFYLNSLENYSSYEYEKNSIKRKIIDKSPLRGVLYRNFVKSDNIFKEGNLPHIAKITSLNKRIIKIRKLVADAKTIKPIISVNKNSKIVSFYNEKSKLPNILNISCPNKRSNQIVLPKDEIIYINLQDFSKSCNYKNASYTMDEFKTLYPIYTDKIYEEDFNKKLFHKNTKLTESKEKKFFKFKSAYQTINNNISINSKIINLNKNHEICLANNAILEINNSQIYSKGKDTKILIKGCGKNPGSILIKNSEINFSNLYISNLSSPKKKLNILYGGLNVIKSIFKADNLSINNSLSEDGVNFIDSDVNVNLIKAENINSDAIDFDFSRIKVNEIYCKNVSNDCIDLSFSKALIGRVNASRIKDKAISIGESSIVKINDLKVIDSDIGLVAKDKANVNIENYQQKNVKLPIAAFIKKPEFDGPTLKINNFKKEDLKNSLISNDSKVLLSGELFKSNLNSEIISNMLYGNLYGVKTQR